MANHSLFVWGSVNVIARPAFILIKGIGFFMVLNVLYASIQPPVARLSAYNLLFRGRERLPFGEAQNSFVVSIDDVDAMFASHEFSAGKKREEIRIAVIGDSSVWGENLRLHETLTGQWNQFGSRCGDKLLEVYNLGYPHPSAVKDLIFIEKIRNYEPDAIVWMITLNTLSSRRVNPFLIENRDAAVRLLDEYNLPFFGLEELIQAQESFGEKTIVGQRSFLARWVKLQALGFLWNATGKDTDLFHEPVSISNDVSDDVTYRESLPGADFENIMLPGALDAGYEISGNVPVLLVNEPIFIATGLNSDLRYNDFYPRWVYDQYRESILSEARGNNWTYLDLWDSIPQEYFTDTPLHLNAQGERLLAERLSSAVRPLVCN